eukprot:c18000_g1_i1 orf=330-686(+)
MGRGVSSGGGQSSLGYLFGSDEPAKPSATGARVSATPAVKEVPSPATQVPAGLDKTSPMPESRVSPDIAAGHLGNNPTNNYHRADGQNTGNFITDRPSTKVHSAPGGGSSLGYLFGGN